MDFGDSNVKTMFGTSGKRRWQALREVYKRADPEHGVDKFNELKEKLKSADKADREGVFLTTLNDLGRKMKVNPRDEPGQGPTQ